MSDRRVNVYLSEYQTDTQDIVARVRYNAELDFWDGRNWSNGGTGYHKGITKLRDGRYVIIIGTQWQGQKDWAYVVAESEALQEILNAQRLDLLKTKKFASLGKLYKEQMIEEDLTEEEE